MPQFGGASEKCTVCAKTVYLAEKIVVEDKDEKKTFHKQCLKCSHCKATLSLGNYASMNGVFYCKPHFKQLFATKGNYDEGFGKEKLTSKWAPNAPPAASTAGSFVPVEKDEIPAPKPSEKKDSPAPGAAGRFGSSEKCEKCSKTVYATEKIVVEEKDGKKVYHKTCLRCAHCQNLLTLGNYASMNGVTYCKPHFKQLFAAKGNYDEGFGKEKHTTKWEGTPTSGSPSSFIPVEKTDTPKESKTAPVNEVASKFKGMSTSDKCTACGKTVYLTERTVVEDKEDKKVFHKNCLRCKHCSVVLSLGNYASMGGVMYCKPHFKQLFASKGNYDEGFGKQKHTAKWIEQEGDQTTTTTSERDDEPHEHHHQHEEGHEGHHKDHSFETTTSSHHEHHDDHEHEHKHEEHEHEHKDGEHEHHHHHEEGDEHHHEGEHHHHEGEHHHHEGEHHHHEGEHHHEHEHEGHHSHEEEAPVADDE